MEKKYKRQKMDADEARELLCDIRDGRIKSEEVDWATKQTELARTQGHNI